REGWRQGRGDPAIRDRDRPDRALRVCRRRGQQSRAAPAQAGHRARGARRCGRRSETRRARGRSGATAYPGGNYGSASAGIVAGTNRVNQARAQLPPEVQRNGVTTKTQSTSLLQVVAIYSPKGTRDALFLSSYAKINIVDTLKRVTGVGDASQWGDLECSMRIWLNLDRMASLDITPADVVNAINSQNTQAAVGRV